MTETHDLARHLFNDVTVSGTLDLDAWVTFKSEHGVEPHQIEPVLVEVIQHCAPWPASSNVKRNG